MIAIQRAYDLLEIAAAGQHGIKKLGSYGKGIGLEMKRRDAEARKANEWMKLCPDITQRGKDGKYLRDESGALVLVPFEEAMANLLPREKKVERVPKFIKWLIEFESINSIAAEKRIATLKNEGLHPNTYQEFRLNLQGWKKESVSKERSVAGKKGAAVKAGKKAAPTPQKKKKTSPRGK